MIDKLEKTFDKTPSRDTLTDKMNEIIDHLNSLENSYALANAFGNYFTITDQVRYCGNCDKTDGLCYTSNPPMVKCTITGNYHYCTDVCDCEEVVKNDKI